MPASQDGRAGGTDAAQDAVYLDGGGQVMPASQVNVLEVLPSPRTLFTWMEAAR